MTIDALQDLRIGVIYGGPSGERAVSLESGTAVYEALASTGLDVVPMLVEDADDTIAQLDATPIDVAFIALHGMFGEDGEIQDILDARGIPCTGADAETSRICMDKAWTKRVLRDARVPTPDWRTFAASTPLAQIKEAAAALTFPLVVKPTCSGSSLGVSIVREADALPAAVAEAYAHGDAIMLERFVRGRELTVGLVDGQTLPIVEVISHRGFYDYAAKYEDDGTSYHVPAPLLSWAGASVQRVARRTFEALGCRDLARVDVLLPCDSAVPQVIEVNTIPGMTGHSLLPKAAAAARVDFVDLCLRLVDAASQRVFYFHRMAG